MKILSGIYWDRGCRPGNQDSLTLQQAMTVRGRVLMAVVSDGIGGLPQGENASGFITEKLIRHFYHELISLVGRGKGRKALERSFSRCFHDINEDLRRYAEARDIRLGATVSLLFVWGRRYLTMHLGDSRIYLCRRSFLCRDRVRQLTRDHSGRKNGLTKCMGSFPYEKPDSGYGYLYGKCGFLLCSDGFYRRMGREAFHVISPREIREEDQICRRLREIAVRSLERGEQDNLSAVYTLLF